MDEPLTAAVIPSEEQVYATCLSLAQKVLDGDVKMATSSAELRIILKVLGWRGKIQAGEQERTRDEVKKLLRLVTGQTVDDDDDGRAVEADG